MASMQLNSLHKLVEVENWADVENRLKEDPTCALEIGGSYKSLPLLVALMHRPPLTVVQALLKANPGAASAKNALHMLPLRVAIRNKAAADVIMAVLEAFPDGAKSVGGTRKTCLHLACMYQPEFVVFQKLLEIWPEAAAQPDQDGWYPLHLACLCTQSDGIITALVTTYPKAVSLTCTLDEELPMHLAALHGASPQTLRLLYESYHEGVSLRTKTQGWTALHLACCRTEVTPEIIQTLVDMNPAATRVAGKICGSLPLHLAARNNCITEVLEVLLKAFPGAAHVQSYSGETPLNCGRGRVQEVIHHWGIA